MKTVACQDDLRILGKTLQERLHAELSDEIRFQVQCALKPNLLMVLAQHRASQQPNPQEVFRVLQQGVERERPDFYGQVRLFLRVVEQRKPYAYRKFMLTPPVEFEPDLDSGFLDADISISQAFVQPVEPEVEVQDAPPVVETPEPPPSPQKRIQQVFEKYPVSLILAGAGVSIASFAGAFYLLSRPCVVGRCLVLEQSQAWTTEAIALAEDATHPLEIQTAHKQLTLATRKLKSVPFWSSHRSNARQLAQANREPLQELELLLAAMGKAMSAAVKSQNPPHPVATWQEVQGLWQSAIAGMEALPEGAVGYDFAQIKWREYQRNLGTINQRIEIERQAQRHLDSAKSAARIAEARQGIADSSQDWQLVENTWLTALNVLRQIPSGTMVHAEATALINSYSVGLAAARDRQSQEQFATQLYNQALNYAAQAQDYETEQQFSLAVVSWQNAVAYIQQIPDRTFYAPQVKPLAGEYRQALTKAQDRLRLTTALQQTRVDLARSCTSSPTICTYDVTDSRILVKLTPDYVRTVRETFISAGGLGDYNTLAGIDEHVQTLQFALEAISRNAGLPLEIYDPYGQLMSTYVPRT
ncbi:hypothetical protein QQ054_13695 [Oscillatoria amoena NRMC-F 0135]|nr:hypothetical protein [Geitlerinema splendidum]MDL5047075.1 hypothetical protein [Oscillatoria amoena NRMC-F 0135]